MAKKKKQPKKRCKRCGGTGLADGEHGEEMCDCPAGRAREAADYSWGMFE